MKKIIFTVFVVNILSSCVQHQDHYYWGSYEPLLLEMYTKPGQATPDVQIDKLTADIQKAEGLGKPIPPGVFAHLGLMYATIGYVDQAEAAFLQEKNLYPESKTLIDGMMNRARVNR